MELSPYLGHDLDELRRYLIQTCSRAPGSGRTLKTGGYLIFGVRTLSGLLVVETGESFDPQEAQTLCHPCPMVVLSSRNRQSQA